MRCDRFWQFEMRLRCVCSAVGVSRKRRSRCGVWVLSKCRREQMCFFFHVRFVFISSAMLRYIFFGRSDLFLPHTHYLATWKSDTISVTFWHCVNCQVEKKSSSVPSSILLDTASRSHTHSHTAQEKRIQFFAFVSNCVTCTQCTITILSNQMQLFGIFFLAVPNFRFGMRHNTNTRKSLENLSIISILCVCHILWYFVAVSVSLHSKYKWTLFFRHDRFECYLMSFHSIWSKERKKK